MTATAERKLIELGITLHVPRAPVGSFDAFTRVGNFLYISGQICATPQGDVVCKGQLGDSASMEDAIVGARTCVLSILAQTRHALGSLDRVVRVVRLGGFVSAVPGFPDGSRVLDGASDLMVAVFGDRGRHVRTTVGVAGLPRNASVEVDAIFEVD
jgi:enamine deaminase RidA (YjgF/YER057c/UK114 family)